MTQTRRELKGINEQLINGTVEPKEAFRLVRIILRREGFDATLYFSEIEGIKINNDATVSNMSLAIDNILRWI